MKITMTSVGKRQRARFNIHKNKEKIVKRFYIQKARHFEKSKTIYVPLLYIKSKTIYVSQFFMKILKFAFIYKKYDTLCSVMFLYTKSLILCKNQENFALHFYIQKSGHFALRNFSLNF